MTISTLKLQIGAGKDPLLDGYLSAFGISTTDSIYMPPIFKSKYEQMWFEWCNAYVTRETGPLFLLFRVLAFIEHLNRKGQSNIYTTPPQMSGTSKRLSPKLVYEGMLTRDLSVAALEIATLLRKTDLFAAFKAVQSKSMVKTGLTTSIMLQLKRKTDVADVCLGRLRGILKNDGHPPIQLLEKLAARAPSSKAKPKVLTPKADLLMVQFSSTTGWLPVANTSTYSAWLIRARESKLVLKIVVNVNPHLVSSVTPSTITRLWATAFRTIK